MEENEKSTIGMQPSGAGEMSRRNHQEDCITSGMIHQLASAVLDHNIIPNVLRSYDFIFHTYVGVFGEVVQFVNADGSPTDFVDMDEWFKHRRRLKAQTMGEAYEMLKAIEDDKEVRS